MKTLSISIALSLFIATAGTAAATGVMTCKSGPQSGWQSQDVLKAKLIKQGWKIRKMKVDGGCYEVYAYNAKGKRVETYFHPVSLKLMHTSVQDAH
ncbi:MAG: PepSY domain-containing protein [Beijerinckiaceae bacterium]|jgi:hypothetical protein|nr:PepSY domain-containing protein [Beijerinckiaceae bacterium]